MVSKGFGILYVAAAFCAAVGAVHAKSVIRLADGSEIRGEIVSRLDSMTVIASPSLGKIRVRSQDIVSAVPEADTVAKTSADKVSADKSSRGKTQGQVDAANDERADGADASARRGDPADQALFFMPTAFMPPKNSFNFRDFELFFMTMGYSPTATTSLTGGFLFPITTEFPLLTAGIKQQLWSDAQGLTALALTGNVTKPIGENIGGGDFLVNSNLVAGKRFLTADGKEISGGFHAAVGYLGLSSESGDARDKHWDAEFSFGLGTEMRLTSNAKFIAEYLSAVPFGAQNDIHGGMLTVGLRLHGQHLAADIAGVRPITDADLGSFVFAPLLVVSYRI